MSRMNIAPAFRYRFADTARGAAVFFVIMVLVMLGFSSLITFTVNHGGRASGSFSAFGISAAVAMFVMGICTIREDVRLMLQSGVGRRTVFTVELLVMLLISLMLAAAGELLLAVTQAAVSSLRDLYVTDLFQMLFFRDMGRDLTLAAHLQSILCYFGLYACANFTGMFISLVFYRLNKMWTIVVAVGAPIFFFVGLPLLIAWQVFPDFLGKAVIRLMTFSFTSPWTLLLTFSVTIVLISAVNWLLFRRAPVKPVK